MGRKMYYDVEKGCGRMSNSNEVIRRNIRFVRTSLGMTQEQLAFASGMTTACVSRLERVNGNPTVQTLDQIADGLKLQTMRLFDEDLMSPENRRMTALQRSFFAAQELPAERQEELSLLIQNYISLGKLF